ncbi:helix-turn-helix domain-containing protein [Bosea sp. R86505]|uniref:helix-turn-helix domain-containing protein n=1 Tax=Bosea sp. R86505 TaxID=3101710 RepID=UPI0036722053
MISNSIAFNSGTEALLHPVERAGSLLGISRSKIYELMKDGRLRHVKIDNKTLIPQRALAELLEKIGA